MTSLDFMSAAEAAKRALANRCKAAVIKNLDYCIASAKDLARIGRRSCEVNYLNGTEPQLEEIRAHLCEKGFTVEPVIGEPQVNMLTAQTLHSCALKLDWSGPACVGSEAFECQRLADEYDFRRQERERQINDELLPEIITAIEAAVERARKDCFLDKAIPLDVAVLLEEKGYTVQRAEGMVSWGI